MCVSSAFARVAKVGWLSITRHAFGSSRHVSWKDTVTPRKLFRGGTKRRTWELTQWESLRILLLSDVTWMDQHVASSFKLQLQWILARSKSLVYRNHDSKEILVDIHFVVAAPVSARETRTWKNWRISQALNAGSGLFWKYGWIFLWNVNALPPRDKREVSFERESPWCTPTHWNIQKHFHVISELFLFLTSRLIDL